VYYTYIDNKVGHNTKDFGDVAQ